MRLIYAFLTLAALLSIVPESQARHRRQRQRSVTRTVEKAQPVAIVGGCSGGRCR